MSLRWTEPRPLRILDFDCENRPLSYWYDGQCTAEITAIAASFEGTDHVYTWLLGKHEPRDMLLKFRALYDRADMVTGHYIRKHDLPLLNAAMIENRLGKLPPKLTCDTKLDLVRLKDLSGSQEALAAMFGLPEPKHHMTQEAWREANRLTPDGIKGTRKRVVDDVKQHKALRASLLKAGALKAPRVWAP